MALNSDGKQAWQWRGYDGGWKVGTVAVDIHNREIKEEDKWGLVLMRHSHSGGLEWVPGCALQEYPQQPIPEPTVRKAGA